MASGTSVLATYRAVWDVPRLLNLLGANLAERSLFGMIAIYLPAFVMLSFHLSAVAVAPVLILVALGVAVVAGGCAAADSARTRMRSGSNRSRRSPTRVSRGSLVAPTSATRSTGS